jgi:Abnormal spindle-like microcephaly-assoc'd, ASPM-SPD-2-Hydin
MGDINSADCRASALCSFFTWIAAHQTCAVIFVAIVAALVIVTGVLLCFSGRVTNKPPHITTLQVSFFFWLGIGYLLLLLIAAGFYVGVRTESAPLLLGGLLPIGVPWFGALGAVVISLEGIFAYGYKEWDSKYNYWHIGRPLFGAVLGIVAFFTFVLIVSSSGTVPPFLDENPEKAKAKDYIVYYVVAFLVGYREETFRELIRRVTDMILKPVSAAAGTPSVIFKSGGATLSTLDFGTVAVGVSMSKTIDVLNSSKVALLSPRVNLDNHAAAEFVIANDHVSGGNDLKPGESRTVQVTFTPAAAGSYANTLTVTGSNLSAGVAISVSGTA